MDQTAKEQVLSDISALEHQVALFTAELETIKTTDPFNPAQYNAIKSELDTAQTKLDAKKAELATIEDAGQAAQEELASALESIDVGGETVSLRLLTTDEDAYQLVYIAMQKKYTEQAERHAQIVAALKSSYESQIEELEDGMSEISTLRQDNFRLSDKLADAEAKRDAAAILNDEKDEEINRLKTDNENLRTQLESSAKPKESVEDGKAALERWKASRPAVTDLRWEDDRKRTTYIATLVSTGEEIKFGHLEKNKYREVSQAEAESFRNEQPAEPVQADAVQDTPLGGSVLEPPTLPIEASVQVPPPSDNGTVALPAEELTRRLLALEKRVDELEGIEVAVA